MILNQPMRTRNTNGQLNLTKKQAIEMVINYKRNIREAERFYKDCRDREVRNYIDGINECRDLLRNKFDYSVD